MIIQNLEENETIEIKSGCDIVEKYVVYRDMGDDELALFECGERELDSDHVRVLVTFVDDEWDEFDTSTPISTVLNYFEKRYLEDDITKSMVVLFDENNLPEWFSAMLDDGEVKATTLYEYLRMIGFVKY